MAPVPECWYIYPAATCIRRIFDRIEISKKNTKWAWIRVESVTGGVRTGPRPVFRPFPTSIRISIHESHENAKMERIFGYFFFFLNDRIYIEQSRL